MEQEQVMLGGRVFRPADADEVTFDQYTWIQVAATNAGLGKELMERISPHIEAAVENKTTMDEGLAEDISIAIVHRCFEKGAHLDILSGILVEPGVEWTRQRAEDNREFIARLKGEDIEKVQAILLQGILGFFFKGLDSIRTSPNSSILREAGETFGVGGMETAVESESDQENASESLET